jgi:hypothetical protein
MMLLRLSAGAVLALCSACASHAPAPSGGDGPYVASRPDALQGRVVGRATASIS